MKKFRDFDKARKYVRSLGLKNMKEWIEFSKSPKRPYDIPSNPNTIYKKHGWKGLKDWIGNEYLPFEEAKKFAQSLKIEYTSEWKQYCKSGKKPKNIPSGADIMYKNKGWKGWGDFLGTGRLRDKDFLPFEEARKFIHSLKLKNTDEWLEYCKSGKKPEYIPSVPSLVYKDHGWKGMSNWLGIEFLPFKEAKKFVLSLGLKGQVEWREYCKSGKKPDDIPNTPEIVYKNKGWKGYGDWVGTGRVRNLQFKSFKEARKFVHSLNLKGSMEWREYCRSGKKPEDIPSAPNIVYKDKGWKGYGDWVGTDKKKYNLSDNQVKAIKKKGKRSLKSKS